MVAPTVVRYWMIGSASPQLLGPTAVTTTRMMTLPSPAPDSRTRAWTRHRGRRHAEATAPHWPPAGPALPDRSARTICPARPIPAPTRPGLEHWPAELQRHATPHLGES